MKLDETLQLLALQIPIDPEQLIQYAAEDSVGGWDLDKGGWPVGSLWSVEGKVLYALIRHLQPERVVEIGTHRGCSTTHIATALDINGRGEVITLDLAAGVGDLIPANLGARVAKIAASGVVWLAEQPDESLDIIYEDADHSAETSRDVALLAMRKLKPGGLLITHDAAHDFAWVGGGQQITSDVGATIRRGLEAALGDQFRVYRTDPSDCGFALWRKPGFRADVHSTPVTINHNELPNGVPSNEALTQAIAQVKASVNNPHNIPGADRTFGREPEPTEAAPEKALEDMTKAELEAYAKKARIDLSGARTKADIISRISVHRM